jgi:hypothetical protein
MAKSKNGRSKTDTGALVGTAFSHVELLVTAAAVKLAEKSDFKAPQRAALKRVFAKLQHAHAWQSEHAKPAKK